MGIVRADWHVDALEQALAKDDTDPMSEIAQLKSDGKIIDLTRSVAEIQADLKDTLNHEGRYAEYAHLECPLKVAPDHVLMGGQGNSCYRCPQYTEDREYPRSLLCALGRRQEDLCEEMDRAQAPQLLDRALTDAHCRRLDAAQELADALLTPA